MPLSVTPSTPYLVVDEGILDANIARTASWAGSVGVRLRPHVKTHKCAQIARKQLDAGAIGITVATIGEAEAFVDAGVEDVFIAYPLWLDRPRADRLEALTHRAAISIGVDSVESARNSGALMNGHPLEVLIEVDSGQHRSGVLAVHVDEVARAATEAGLSVGGVFTFPGHAYDPTGRAAAARDEAEALREAGSSLRRAGIEPIRVSGGCTPSLALTDADVVTESRPGVYVFGDAQQWELGSCRPEDIALTAAGTVVSHAGGRAVIDTGSKILGADRAGYATGYGRLLDHPEARIIQLSEHHAVVDFSGAALPALGSVVRVVPNHVCNAVNLVDDLYVSDGSQLTDQWRVAARGANS